MNFKGSGENSFLTTASQLSQQNALEKAAQDLITKHKKMEAAATQYQEATKTVYIRDKSTARGNEDDEEVQFPDDDELLEGYDDSNDIEAWRAKRMQQMKAEQEAKAENLGRGHGELREIVETEFLKEVTGSEFVVCHFYHDEFMRSKVMDKHLRMIAPQHLSTKFVRLNAEKAPFFVEKLAIKVLPTVVFFKDGVAIDRLIGFEGLNATDDFATGTLERRIKRTGILKGACAFPYGEEDENDYDSD